ncbi:MAG: hypothetical protein RJA99_5035 [Pseudomonadota bacterium]
MPRTPREWIAVLWPAFVAACLLEIVVFAAFDPHDFTLFGWQVDADNRDAVYSVAFFAFWAICAAAGVVTWSLSRPSEEINRLQRPVPLDAPRRGHPPAPGYRGPNPPPGSPPGSA